MIHTTAARSHAPRGNATLDVPRPQGTQRRRAPNTRVPTQSVGTRSVLAAIFAMLLITAPALGQPAADPYAEALGYKFGQPRIAVMAIEAEIRAAKPEQLRVIEGKLLAMLQNPAATTACKDCVCRQLRQAGSERSAAPLAALLADKDLATVARLAMESIPGAKIDAALRDALPRLQGDLKTGAILTIGARGDRQAVALLAPLAGDKDPATAEAAFYALGRIGGADALRAVQTAAVPDGLKRARFHAVLLCAERMATEGQTADSAAVYRQVFEQSDDVVIKTAALRGIVATDKAQAAPMVTAALKGKCPKLRLAAARFACEPGGAEVLGPVLADLSSLPGDAQVAILDLANDKAALPTALAAFGSSEQGTRVAALGAVGRLGDAAVLPRLLEIAAKASGDEQAAARRGLQGLRGEGIDASLVAAAGAGESARRVEAIRALAARSATASNATLLKGAEDADPAVRAESLRALAVLADAQALPAMVKLLADAKSAAQRDAVESAVIAACRRLDDKGSASACVVGFVPGAGAEVRCSLLRVLARIPTARALEALRAGLAETDAAVKDTAVRGMAEWPDAAAMADLLGIARSAKSPVHKVLALRGLVRLAGLPGGSPAAATAKALAEALALADRIEDKKMVLAALAEVNHAAALDAALGCLADKELEVEAAAAAVKIAKSVRVGNPDAAKAAVQKVLEVCKSPAARQLAESALAMVDVGENIAPQGTAGNPDGLAQDGGATGNQAAIDGNPATYWDEVDNQKLYRLTVTFKRPEKIAAVSILGYEHHDYAPKDFEVLCDSKVVKKVENAQYDNNSLLLGLGGEVTCTTVEFRITGCYGRSPAIRELGIYRPKAGK
jgi:HEAT repeat protein